MDNETIPSWLRLLLTMQWLRGTRLTPTPNLGNRLGVGNGRCMTIALIVPKGNKLCNN
jgi:hypothetical protein